MQGRIHAYYGYGKGKTTAALGMCLRMCGAGKKVWFVQFLKDAQSSELQTLALLPNVTVRSGAAAGFVRDMQPEALAKVRAAHDRYLAEAAEAAKKGLMDMLILDEVFDALQLELIDRTLFDAILLHKPEPLELVMTGHEADPRILDMCDYISEIRCIKHPYMRGIGARRGIEF